MQLTEFEIHTDQQALVHLNDQRLHTVWQQKVFTKLLCLPYKIVYKKGSDNSAADALSRRQHPLPTCFALSVVTPEWCSNIRQGYQSDDQATTILAKLAAKPDSVPNFSLLDDLIHNKDKLWVGNNTSLQQQLIEQMHSSPIGGHSGIPATVKQLQALFAWPGLRKHVHDCEKLPYMPGSQP